MREPVDAEKIQRLLEELGKRSRGGGSIFLNGGASALLVGWRSSTIDVDLKLDPEPPGIFEAIAQLKNELDINIELAAPDQFVPTLSDWRSRSTFIGRYGNIDTYHYDFRAQALAKLARFHDRDRQDILAMIDRGLLALGELKEILETIHADLIRFPALELKILQRRLQDLSDDESA